MGSKARITAKKHGWIRHSCGCESRMWEDVESQSNWWNREIYGKVRFCKYRYNILWNVGNVHNSVCEKASESWSKRH